MINRLVITPDLNYSKLTPQEKELWSRSHEVSAMASLMAQNLYKADNIDGIDMDPRIGSIHVQAQEELTIVDQKMIVKDPGKEKFDLKNLEAFQMIAINQLTGQFSAVTLQNGAELDTDGDGAKEKGLLCTIQDGIAQKSGQPEINGTTNILFNDNAKCVTILEEVPDNPRSDDFGFNF